MTEEKTFLSNYSGSRPRGGVYKYKNGATVFGLLTDNILQLEKLGEVTILQRPKWMEEEAKK